MKIYLLLMFAMWCTNASSSFRTASSSSIVVSRRPIPQTSIVPTTIIDEKEDIDETVPIPTDTEQSSSTVVAEETTTKVIQSEPIDELPTRLWSPRKRFGATADAESSFNYSSWTALLTLSLGFAIILLF